MNDAIRFRPIGVIRTPFQEARGTPIQGVFSGEARGTVEVFAEFEEGLRDIDSFSHIYLLYVFHRVQPGGLTCVPFLDDQPHGVFATRAPVRPNAIGLSIVRLIDRVGRVLSVADIDVLDGAPLLDIKPFVPRFDARPEAGSGWFPAGEHPRASEGADDRFGP